VGIASCATMTLSSLSRHVVPSSWVIAAVFNVTTATLSRTTAQKPPSTGTSYREGGTWKVKGHQYSAFYAWTSWRPKARVASLLFLNHHQVNIPPNASVPFISLFRLSYSLDTLLDFIHFFSCSCVAIYIQIFMKTTRRLPKQTFLRDRRRMGSTCCLLRLYAHTSAMVWDIVYSKIYYLCRSSGLKSKICCQASMMVYHWYTIIPRNDWIVMWAKILCTTCPF